jgi:hypothetical protein
VRFFVCFFVKNFYTYGAMKKYSILIILGCLGNYSFATSDASYRPFYTDGDSIEEVLLEGEQVRNQKFQRMSAKLKAFSRVLGLCKTCLNRWSSDSEDSSGVPSDFREHVDAFIVGIARINGRIGGLVSVLEDVEAAGGSVAEYRGAIMAEIVDAFSVLAMEILERLKEHKESLDLEIYKRAKSALNIAMQVSLGIGVVMDMGEVFCPNGCCLLL